MINNKNYYIIHSIPDMRTFSLCFFGGTLLINGFMFLPSIGSWGWGGIILSVFCAPAVFLLPGQRRWWFALLAVMLGFGYAWLEADTQIRQQLPESLAGKDLLLTGVIRGLPEADSESRRFLFQLETASTEERLVDLSGTLRLSWYRHFPPRLNSGERWQLVVRAKPPNGFMNPGGMDYEKWLFAQRIIATGYVRDSGHNRPLGMSSSGYIDHLRQQVQRAIQYHLEGRTEQSIVAALAVAARSDISDQQWEVLRRTGTSHLVAISGLHIALVAGFGFLPVFMIWWLFPRLYLWMPVRIAAGFTGALAALLYALMAGFTLPTQRALVMVLIILAGLLWRRQIPFTVILSWALLAVLLIDPLAAMSPGFWLSFLSVLMIFLLTRRDLRRKHKWGVLSIQLGLSLGMIPLTASLFGSASLVSPLANLVAVPYVSLLVVPLVLSGMLLLPLSEYLAAVCWQLAGYAVRGLWWLLDWLSGLDLAALALPQLPWYWLAAAIAGFVLLILPRGIPGRWLGVLLMLPVLVWQPQRPAPGAFQLDVLDVGQGLASVIQTAEHTLVFDTGPKPSESFDAGRLVVLPWLRALNINRLDGLLVSHPDTDHSGGAGALLEALPVDRLISNTTDYARSSQYLPELCQAGQHWEWDGVRFEILHPAAGFADNRDNNRACVLRVGNALHSVLFSADIERPAEYWLSKTVGDDLRSEVLIVPHHGSDSSSSPAFLKRVEPKLAILTAGYRSRFNHPHPEVVKRYQGWGIPLLNTVQSGAITVSFPADNQAFSLQQFRPEQRRFWNR
ncbi:MAG: DNA internalization-related competence protein ComEC/Rec2 [Thiolinea sp.]